MSRCPYCRRELPGFETLCQRCFEKGYERVAHPKPWWQRPRLTLQTFFTFLFVFVYTYIILAINRENHPTMTGLGFLALILAAGLILMILAMRDSNEPKMPRRGAVYIFLILFLCFFLRLWVESSYHPLPNPGLWALVAATISAIAESFRADSDQSAEQRKKAPEDSRRL